MLDGGNIANTTIYGSMGFGNPAYFPKNSNANRPLPQQNMRTTPPVSLPRLCADSPQLFVLTKMPVTGAFGRITGYRDAFVPANPGSGAVPTHYLHTEKNARGQMTSSYRPIPADKQVTKDENGCWKLVNKQQSL